MIAKFIGLRERCFVLALCTYTTFEYLVCILGARICSACLVRASQQPLNQHVLCGFTRGTCFWDCQSMHVQWSVKSGRRAKHMYYIERVSLIWAWFQTAQNARIFKKTTCYICSARRCCSLLYSSFLMWTSRHCGCIYTLCLLFRFCARLLTLPCSHHDFCHFCRCNNETASAATALRTINFPKCTQHFVSKVF